MTRVSHEQGVTIIELGPRYESLDEPSLMDFAEVLLSEATHAAPPCLLLDLGQTNYIGSSCIEILVRAWKRLKERNGALALCGVGQLCGEVLQVTCLDQLWPLYPTRADAIAALDVQETEQPGANRRAEQGS